LTIFELRLLLEFGMIYALRISFQIGMFCALRIYVVVRNAWGARIILLRYMCEEKEEKTCPSWMLALHGSQKNKGKE